MENSSPSPTKGSSGKGLPLWLGPAICGAIVAVFYFVVPGFGQEGGQTPAKWLYNSWNSENDFEHGFLVPLVVIGLVVGQWKRLNQLASESNGSWIGLCSILLGLLFFVAGHRCGQPRLAIGGLPMILWGSSLFLWGWAVSRLLFFPLFFLWLSIPVPGFQHATVRLQILSTHLAQWCSDLFGVKTIVNGTQIMSATARWTPLEIDEGCGGIRSLMALIMISFVWGYLAKVSLWKKAILMFSAIPLAILGNMLRLTSIFVIGEYWNPEFARNTWHDWSGLLIFYPISLFMLLVVHSVLERGLPWRRPQKKEVRRVVGTHSQAPDTP